DTDQENDKNPIDISSLVSSAPSSSKIRTVTPEIQKTIEDCSKRSASSVENKYRITITSERLAQLKKIVEEAIKNHHVFTIKASNSSPVDLVLLTYFLKPQTLRVLGGWPVIRRELLKRRWIEKIEYGNKKKFSSIDEVTSNLPTKLEWESPQNYVEKCEKTVMSRMLQSYDVDFYWSMRKEPSDLQHRANAFKLVNRFSRSLFASKEGLALLLQHSYWYTEAGVSCVNYPRVYVLEGKVPYTALQFALDRCNDYVGSQKHLDIDKEFVRIWDHEWADFLCNYYTIVHEHGLFLAFGEPLPHVYAKTKSTLKDIYKYWPQYDIDGMRNIWILKPGNKCRGRGIQLVKHISDVERVLGLKVKLILERPLILYKTKFDIRQWFMVTSVQPLTIWMYRDCYLRFSSQIFSLDNFHESLHLTNHAVQCKYTNVQQRDKALPDDNMWDSFTFKAYLKQIGCMDKWNEVIYPGMQQSIVCAMLASQDTMDRRQNTFELYGADFMLSEDFKPWLLEINCSPDLSFSTKVTSRLCPQCMEDIVKVVIDRRRDPNADTGLFQLVYKQNFPRIPAYLGLNLSVRGRRVFRNRSRIRTDKDKKESNKEKEKERMILQQKKQEYFKQEYIKKLPIINSNLVTTTSVCYKGPVIEDLIEELHKSVGGNDSDSTKVPKPKPTVHKKNNDGMKAERVSKTSSCRFSTNRTHSFYRRQSAKENIKKPRKVVDVSDNNCFGVFHEGSIKSKITSEYKPSCEDMWEKETVSILKGANILSSCSANTSDDDPNKNCFRPYCLTTFDLNKLLPQLNGGNGSDSDRI
ncbi:hypothetical protein NQ318_011096, partial [Aromia moschata]